MGIITEALTHIQAELKAPKNQYNAFAKYNYRSCEDITEAAKPVCFKYGCALTIDDEIVLVGDRFYIKATATLRHKDGESVSASAYAREDESKKGMDAAQLTGATSSYARKYALGGLFALDDTKDADSTNTGEEKPKKKAEHAPAAEECKCCDCGKPFVPFTAKNGTAYTAQQVYHMAMSNNTDGKPRCRECSEKAGTRKEKTNA